MRSLEKLKKKKISNEIFFAFVFIVIALIVWIFILNNAAISDWILFFTFLALLWYAWETWGMKKTMVEQTATIVEQTATIVEQTALEQKPIVDLFFRPKIENHPAYFRLRNSGKGVAYNVQVETVRFDNKIFEFYFKYPNLILTFGDEQTFLVDAKYEYNQSEESESDPLSRFLDNITNKSVANTDKNNPDLLNDKQKTKIIVTYENALNKKFKRIFYIYYKPIKANLAKDYEIEFYKEKTL